MSQHKKKTCAGVHENYNFNIPFLLHHNFFLILILSSLFVKKILIMNNEIFHYLIFGQPQHKNPCPAGHEIYNSGNPFFCHHYYVLSLSDLSINLCLGFEKKILKEILHIHYMTCGHTLAQERPIRRVMQLKILLDLPWSSLICN